MSRVSSSYSKKWMICAATGLALGPAVGFGLQIPGVLQADEPVASLGAAVEPGRIDPAVVLEPLEMDAHYPGSRIVQTQGTAPAGGSQSEIMQQLEALYAKDGRDMPTMDMPTPDPAAAQQMQQQMQAQQQERSAERPSKWNLFDRLFRRNREEPRPQPAMTPGTPTPQQSQVRAPQRPQPGAPQQFRAAGTETRIAPQTFPQPQAGQQTVQRPQQQPQQQQPYAQQPYVQQPQFQQPGAAGRPQVMRPLTPASTAAVVQPQAMPTPTQAAAPQPFTQPAQPARGAAREQEASIRISDARTQEEVEVLLDDALENPFPEVSEEEADRSSTNPFSGMKLEPEIPVAITPAANAAPTIDFDEPTPPLPGAEPELPLGFDEGNIAPAKAEVPNFDAGPTQNDSQRKMQMILSRATLSGLKGFCIVSLRDHRQLRDARPEHQSIHNEQIFQFSSAEAKATFERDPEKYAPASGGVDVVVHKNNRVRVDGSLDHAAWFRGRLYLFTTPETLATFEAEPARYAVP